MGARLSDRKDWFTLWEEDRKSILATMQANMASDLECGYSTNSNSIKEQRADIAALEQEVADAYESFKNMTEVEVNRWCFYELKRKGAIE